MATSTEVQEGDFIRMDASLAGQDFSWSPDQVLRVRNTPRAGDEITVEFANALISDPPDFPRAHKIGESEARYLLGEAKREHDESTVAPVNEIPPYREEPKTETERQVPVVDDDELFADPPLDELERRQMEAEPAPETEAEPAPEEPDEPGSVPLEVPPLEGPDAWGDDPLGREGPPTLEVDGEVADEGESTDFPGQPRGRGDTVTTAPAREEGAGGESEASAAEGGEQGAEASVGEPAAPEAEAGKEDDVEEPQDGQQRSEEEGVERATSPEAEKRETATPRRTRRRVKPPQDDEKKK